MSAKQVVSVIMTHHLFVKKQFLLVHACCGDNGAATIRSDWHMYTREEVIKLEQISF